MSGKGRKRSIPAFLMKRKHLKYLQIDVQVNVSMRLQLEIGQLI